MAIGAISAYGAVNAVSFRPYVYNANTVSAVSLNRLSRISDDVLDKKIDYSELTDESLNENPLKKGQTLDFQGILDMQMRRGQHNAARIMKPAGTVQETEESAAQPMMNPGVAVSLDMEEAQTQEIAEEVNAGEASGANGGGDNINYQMQQALRAYEMFMTA